MSFARYKQYIEDGDTIILFLGFDNTLSIRVSKGTISQTRYGALRHSELIGRKYGSQVHCPKGYLYVLYPTPELWTVNVPHRTQILYSTDISLVTLQLDLRPGSVILEAGTGSGSLSHAFVRTIMPSGHLHTFEFHEQRAEIVKKEFEVHELSEYVTSVCRDVSKDGFGVDDEIADAVFLDMPSPWPAIPFAKKALKKQGGRICTFSPCIEQVQKTHDVLKENGFEDCSTVECLVRNFDVRTTNLIIPDLGDDEMSKLEKTSEERNQDTNSTSSCPSSEPSSADSNNKTQSDKTTVKNETKNSTSKFQSSNLVGRKMEDSFQFKSGVAPTSMPGHTGYLTFATLYL